MGPPFPWSFCVDLFLTTAFDKFIVDLFWSSLWGLPSGLQGPPFQKDPGDIGSQNVHWGPKLFCWGPKWDPKSIQSYTHVDIDPANICFSLPILTHTAFVDKWNNSRIDRQADTQNVRCRGVADVGWMVALFITALL